MGRTTVTAKTPVYQLEYLVQGEPARNTRGALERNALSIEAALLAKAVPAPGAADLAQVAARVLALENWRAPAAEHRFTQGTSTTNWVSTAYAWTAALGAQLTVPADGRPRSWGASCAVNVKDGTMWWRYVMDLAAGPGKAAATTYWPNATGFKAAPPAGSELSYAIQAGGVLAGDQAATFYLQARADVGGVEDFILPTVRHTSYAD